jgi:HAD superfamily hydrolase (TIGR01509 family)
MCTALLRTVGLITPEGWPFDTRSMFERYRVLSLDLHDTFVWDTPAIVEAQYEVRWTLFLQGFRMPNGGRVPVEELRRARGALYSELKSEGRPLESVPVATQVDQIRRVLGAQYAVPLEQVVRSYAEGGLKEHPPVFNPEAQALVRQLNYEGLPVIIITDTSRSGSAWKSFLEGAGGVRLAHVIASTDVGACKPDPRIFAEAARRAGVPASKILHVGDSWVWDVEGARRSGMGAALYRGLWAHYWDPANPREVPPVVDPSVPCFDHLSEARSLLDVA